MKTTNLVILLMAIVTFSGCAEKRWMCYVDKNKDSKCFKADCIKLTESGFFDNNCKNERYRIMKVFPLREAFVYRLDPPTDIQKCREYGNNNFLQVELYPPSPISKKTNK